MDPSQNPHLFPNYSLLNQPQGPDVQSQNSNVEGPSNSQNMMMHPNFQMPFVMPQNFGMQYPYQHPYMPFGYVPRPENTYGPLPPRVDRLVTDEPSTPRVSSGSTDIPLSQHSANRSGYVSWTTEDNKSLLTGYFHFSNDSELGANQKGDTFWGKIAGFVNQHSKGGVERTANKCQTHYRDLNKKISSFVGCYSTATRDVHSGWSDDDYVTLALQLYNEQRGTRFNLLEEWKLVRDQPKYMTGVTESGSSGSKRKSGGDNVESVDPHMVRPEGRDAAKKKARGSSSKSSIRRQQQILEEMQRRSEQPPKRNSIRRDHGAAHKRLMADYFDESCTYTDLQFRRRYRMRRPLFLRIVDSLSNYDNYFTQRRNSAGKLGLTPIQKCTAAIRMLAYGVSADACYEYVKIGETTALECTWNFCDGVIALFQDEYLRRPTAEDLQRLLQVGQDRGFPGMIGSIDCMHWEWRNCPKAWQGQFTSGHKGKATVILEAVASYDLWIWHAFFGLPGSLNDINVLERSPVFDDIESGETPEVNFTVNGRQYNYAYYLADGIYPKWPVFVQTIQLPQGSKAQLFAKQQESCRKDVERAFGVLQARFAIIRQPARMWDIEVLGKILRACIILHNMIVEDERDTYSHNWEHIDYDQSTNASSSSSFDVHTQVLPQFEVHVQSRSKSSTQTRAQIRDRAQHIQLKKDLVEHIWQKFGETRD